MLKACIRLIERGSNAILFEYDAIRHQTAVDRFVLDCACTPPQIRCCEGVEFPSLNYFSGRAENDPIRGPNPFDWDLGGFTTLGRTDVDQVHEHLGGLHQMVFDLFGRDGGNGMGGTGTRAEVIDSATGEVSVSSTLTFTDASTHAEVSNDAFGGDPALCGARFATSGVIVMCSGNNTPDIVGHEYGHSISTSLPFDGSTFERLSNFNEPGTIAESFSDFFGEVYQDYTEGSNDWLLEVADGQFIRSLIDPPSLIDPSTNHVQADRLRSSDFFCGAADQGGVHLNSGVLNKASYLMSEGGDFNTCDIAGIGIDKVAQIWYRAVSVYFVPEESFNSAYTNLIQACNDLYTPQDCLEVTKALQAVELDQLSPCSGLPATGLKPACSMLGDFDNDGDVDIDDLNMYNGNIGVAATGAIQALDLNGDGIVGSDDHQQHYTTLVEASNGVTGTLGGDINLDGAVSVLGDAFILVQNLGLTNN